jgi:lysophospholipase L1-like esterase
VILSVIGDSICGGCVIDGVFVEEGRLAYPATLARRIGATELTVRHISGGFTHELVALAGTLPASTNLLIVNAGTNDIFALENGTGTLDLSARAFDALLAVCRAHVPAARIAIVGVRHITETDRHSAAHAAGLRAAAIALNDHFRMQPRTTFVEIAQRSGSADPLLFPDRIHPSPAGTDWLAEAVIEALVAPIRLVAIGDTFAADPQHAYPVIVAQAIGASALDVQPAEGNAAMLQRVAELAGDTRMLLIAASASDVTAIAAGTLHLAAVLRDFDALLDACRARMPAAHIVVVGLRAAGADRAIAATLNDHYRNRTGITFVDLAHRPASDEAALFPDAIHPSIAGARWIADAVIAALGGR